MATKKPIILMNGNRFRVECAIMLNGKSPADKFIKGLEDINKAKIIRLVKRFANFGEIKNREQFKKVEDEVWEFKSFQIRLMMYHCAEGCIALTHGFIKKDNRIKKSEISKAKKIISEYNEIRKRLKT